MAAILESQTNPTGAELFSYVNTFFVIIKFEWLLATWEKTLYSAKTNCAFSLDVTAAILVFQNNGTVAMLVYQTKLLIV